MNLKLKSGDWGTGRERQCPSSGQLSRFLRALGKRELQGWGQPCSLSSCFHYILLKTDVFEIDASAVKKLRVRHLQLQLYY